MSHQEKKSAAHSSHQTGSIPPDSLFRTLIEESTAITLLLTIDGRILYSSPSANAMLAYSSLEADSLLSLIHNDDFAAVQRMFEAAARTPRATSYIECRLCCQDGSWRWFEGTCCNLIHLPSVNAIACTLHDITLREQQAEQLLEEQQQQLHVQIEQQVRTLDAVLSSISDFAYIFDLSGRFIYTNQAHSTLLERPKDQIIGKNFYDLDYPFDLARRLQDQVQEVISTKKTLKDETPFTSPTGYLGYYEYIFVPIFAHDGSVSAVAGSTRDISERHQAEQERQRLLEREQVARKVIENNNTLLRFVADFMPQKVWTADAHGQFTYFNQRWTSYTGLSEQELSQHWEQASAPAEQEEQRRQWAISLATGQRFQYEHHLRHADGTYRWHLSRAFAQTDADGQVFMWIGTSTDIDEQKKQEEQKDAFISMASHELRTPLTTIKGALQIAERRSRNILQNEEAQLAETRQAILDISTMLNRALRQVGIQTRLIKDLLDVSRIQQNKFSLSLARADLKNIVIEAIDDQLTFTPKRAIELQELPQVPLPVLVDRERINQVLANYLSNALKYSPATEPVLVGIRHEEHLARVWVQDKGLGLSFEQQQQIWQRFYQVDGIEVQNGSSVGLGLGLHICQTIIEQHEGQVGVESWPDKGSTFWFTLPLIDEEAISPDE